MTLTRRTNPFDRLLTLRIPKAEEVEPRQGKITATSEARPERELAGAGAAG